VKVQNLSSITSDYCFLQTVTSEKNLEEK